MEIREENTQESINTVKVHTRNEHVGFLMISFLRILIVIDPFINIWMLSKYKYFSNTIGFFISLICFVVFRAYKLYKIGCETTTIFSKLLNFFVHTGFLFILLNVYFNLTEFIYNILKIFIYDFMILKQEIPNIFLSGTSIFLIAFISLILIISTKMIYTIEMKYFSQKFIVKPKNLVRLNNLCFVSVLSALIIYSHFSFSDNLIFKKIVMISFFTFISTVLGKTYFSKFSNYTLHKQGSLINISNRLIYILLLLNQIGYDYLFVNINRDDIIQRISS